MRKQLLMVLVVSVACMSMVGCGLFKKKGPKSGGLGDDIGGVAGGSGIGEGALGDRFEGGTETAGMFTPVYFEFDSTQIKTSERGTIDAVAAFLKKTGTAKVIVEGHCDERGSNEYNLSLGERRALAIRAYLTGLGIDGERVQTKSYGEERAVAMGHDEASWSKNRRGEFILVQ